MTGMAVPSYLKPVSTTLNTVIREFLVLRNDRPPAGTIYRACANNHGFGNDDYSLSPSVDYDNISINKDIVMFRQINNEQPDQVGALQALKTIWQDAQQQLGLNTWQYAASATTFAVSPALQWQCNADTPYYPPSRPYYRSSIVGQGNYILALDITNTVTPAAFAILKSLLVTFIDSLSFYDYYAVVLYQTGIISHTDTLVQATTERKQETKNWFNTVVQSQRTGTILGNVFEEIGALFSNSEKDSDTSFCHNYTIFFSQGGRSINSPDIYESARQMVVNTYSIVSAFTLQDSAQIQGIVCYGAGFYKKIINTSDKVKAENQVLVHEFDQHLSPHIKVTVPRYSEAYTDLLGLGVMVTSGLPVYDNDKVLLGLYIDVPINQLNNNITANQINEDNKKEQICEELTLKPDTASCPRTQSAEEGSEPGIVKHKDVLFGVGATACVLFSIIMTIVYLNRDTNALLPWLWAFTLLAWMWFWLVYGLAIYDDQVEVNHWKETYEYVTAKTTEPYDCTRTVNCGCSNYYGTSCASAAQQLLSPGSLQWSTPCQTGYHCCESEQQCRYWTTHCDTTCTGSGTRRHCSQNCYPRCGWWETVCVRSVENRACTQVRGICNNVYVDVEYIVNGGLVQTTRVQSCSLNDTECVSNFRDSYPLVGESTPVYYNPWSVSQVKANIGYNAGQWVNLAIPSLYILTVIVLTVWWEYARSGYSLNFNCNCFSSKRQSNDWLGLL